MFSAVKDEVLYDIIISVGKKVVGGFGGDPDKAAEVIANIVIKTFRGEYAKEAKMILADQLKSGWTRAQDYFHRNPSDDRENAIGQAWRAAKNGFDVATRNPDGTITWISAGDPVKLFVNIFRRIFRKMKEGETVQEYDAWVTSQLEFLYQATRWQKFTRFAESLIARRPGLASLGRMAGSGRMVPVFTPNGPVPFVMQEEAPADRVARALWYLACTVFAFSIIIFIVGPALIVYFGYKLALGLVVSGSGAESILGQLLMYAIPLVLLFGIGALMLRLMGFKPARQKYWAVLGFLMVVGLMSGMLAHLPLKDHSTLHTIMAVGIAILTFNGVYHRITGSRVVGSWFTTLASLATVGTVLTILTPSFITSLPGVIHTAKQMRQDFEDNILFTKEGVALYCRPEGDTSPTGEDGDWWMVHVYACVANNPGSSRIGVPGKPLTSEEGIRWLQYKQQLERSENKGGWLDWFGGSDDAPKQTEQALEQHNLIPAAQAEAIIQQVFDSEGPEAVRWMLAICREESGLRHYNDDGTILRGSDNEDIGLCQVNAGFHGGIARNMGIDPYEHDIEEHVRWAHAVYVAAGRSFSPWQRTIDKLEAKARAGGFQRKRGIMFAAPGNGVWGETIDVVEELRSYVSSELERLGMENGKAQVDSIIARSKYTNLERLMMVDDRLLISLDGGEPFRVGQSGTVLRSNFRTIRIMTENAEPYVNRLWVLFPEVD
ncbi:MAG: hypothetical protein COV34_01360 [Candidatus Zambryskibacteria bacterium CG10_big_fil_rev_8_21_14_0_10_42_12]|uniref:Uncharacterized protein n=1 Tax=Candidatus Zambryskibacteria bacterium CG10_big_fil_rev_8_21_14_0_10_42_12 TaxID=1975115 RepID=A0A2H0QX97_9BACT|nr:MAG: hypothetical protein COV34_01360 [Candidatus Zambryskibacteria bacterium CG10_big_fil_rev_8_21_14_0_10_42_12]